VFCYNCGGRVAEDEQGTAEKVTSEAIQTVEADELLDRKTRPAPGMRTAREIKRRERVFDRKPGRVVWEPVASGPEIQLIVVAVAARVFTIVAIILALYLQ
jgi:hypothetical protein